jgi:hypothetical protein
VLLDGPIRHAVLAARETGCRIALDDEAFTYTSGSIAWQRFRSTS